MSARILVVDDHSEIRTLLSRKLTQQGWEVTLADNASHALELLEQSQFQAISTDMDMGYGMHGRLLAAEILKSYPDMNIVMFSGGMDEIEQQFLNMGGLAFYYKNRPQDYFDGMEMLLKTLRGKQK